MDIRDRIRLLGPGWAQRERIPSRVAFRTGVPPQEERDSFALDVLCKWVRAGRFTRGDLTDMLDTLLANLRAGIGEEESDAVFLRSFSALAIGMLVSHDGEKPFLGADNLNRIMDAAVRFTIEERDMRGFVPIKGWADSTAHTADLLDSLVNHPGTGSAEHARILTALATRITAPTDTVIASNEEYRVAVVVLSIARRGLLPVEALAAWAASLGGSDYLKQALHGHDQGRYRRVKLFLGALYVMLAETDAQSAAQDPLIAAVRAALKSYIPWILN